MHECPAHEVLIQSNRARTKEQVLRAMLRAHPRQQSVAARRIAWRSGVRTIRRTAIAVCVGSALIYFGIATGALDGYTIVRVPHVKTSGQNQTPTDNAVPAFEAVPSEALEAISQTAPVEEAPERDLKLNITANLDSLLP
jgi:hypothetical protein